MCIRYLRKLKLPNFLYTMFLVKDTTKLQQLQVLQSLYLDLIITSG